jgi:hypothetical protein
MREYGHLLAGKNRGAIKGILSLQQNFSESDSVNLLNGRVNPVKTFLEKEPFSLEIKQHIPVL